MMELNSTYILAHDLGTSGNKATLFDTDGSILASTQYSYATSYLQESWVEQDPEEWWKAVCVCSQEIIEKAGIVASQVNCITFSGQMMGAVPVDRKGKALRNAIIWADTRAEQEANNYVATFGMQTAYEQTGNRISPSYPAAKIKWLKIHEKDTYSATYKFLQAKDFIVGKMTGEFVTDYSDASGTGLLDITTKKWSTELLMRWGIEEGKLPDIYSSTTVIGGVTKEAATVTGLVEGTPVVLGGADGCCAALGAGVVEEGDIFNYIGSSAWISLASKAPILDPEMRTFNFVHIDEQKVLPMGTMQAAGSAIHWLKEQLYADLSNDGIARLNKDASESAIGANGVLFFPYLLGERSPWWNRKTRGSFLGLAMNHTRQDMARAVLEGISMNLKLILDALLDGQKDVQSMWLFGGGANSHLWRQMLADIYNMDIRVPSNVTETTSMGAAIAGGIGIGAIRDFSVAKEWCIQEAVYEPIGKHRMAYDLLQKKFVEAYTITEKLYG